MSKKNLKLNRLYILYRTTMEGVEEDSLSGGNPLGLEIPFDEIRSKHPSILDVEKAGCNQSDLESCPCGNKIATADYISSISLITNLAQHNIDLAEHSSSESSSAFSRSTLFSILSDLNSAEFSIENLDHEGKISATSLNFPVEHALVTTPVNIDISTPEQCTLGSLQGTVTMRTLLKSWLFFQLATIDRTINQVYTRKFDNINTAFLELPNSQNRPCDSLSPRANLVSMENKRLELKDSGKMLVPHLDPTPKCLYQSTSSSLEKSSVSKGLLQVMWKSGTPYFLFTVGDDCSKIHVANPCKVESSSDKSLDYVYFFHSRTSSTKESRNYSNSTSDSVGKMKVSSSLILDSNKFKFIETEFVLFCADQDSREMQIPVFTATKSKGFPKMMTDLIRTSNSFKKKTNYRSGEPSSKIEDFLQRLFQTKPSSSDKSVLVNHLENDPRSNHELAAIIVKDYRHDSNEEAEVGGWGLKFLDKNTTNHADTPPHPSFDSRGGERNYQGDKGASERSMSVLIPAGLHGSPTIGVGAPSSLTERWRSGGHCDCGGWDTGCPLTVLSNRSIVSEAFQQESLENCKSVDFFVEGNYGESALKMVNTNEDEYIIYFKPTLSALLSFSVAVAIIHTQTPDLYPKL